MHLAETPQGGPMLLAGDNLFNEPRKVGGWSFWRNGGWRNGRHFYGMQQVARSGTPARRPETCCG